MAELWYPNPAVTQNQHERLMGGASASGVIGYPTDLPVVYAPNAGIREVRVRASRQAVVEGYGWENDAALIVLPSLGANDSGSTRVDLVVLRLDRADYSVRVKVKQGTPGAGAPSPTTSGGTSGVWELPLAEVTVTPGATTIPVSAVVNRAWYLGDDGQIRCTEASRPPREAGRRIWEPDTGRMLVSTGGRWLVAVEDTTGVITPASGFNFTAAMCHRRNGLVTFALTVWRPAAPLNANTEYVLGSVPPGFRPPAPGFSNGGTCPTNQSVFTYSISDDGTILMNPGFTPISTNRPAVLNTMTYPVA